MKTTPRISKNYPLIQDIQYNCDISEARDHGIYSMCRKTLNPLNLEEINSPLHDLRTTGLSLVLATDNR